ncbi:MAG: hypothetical protein KF805_08025 [Phycisphaeraceae bacterium]|nr:hypothetical protein [Phycisphaeraceae bacterium]
MVRIGVIASVVIAGVASGQLVNRVNGRFDQRHFVEDAVVMSNFDVVLAGERDTYTGGFQSAATLTRVAPDGLPIWSRNFGVDGDYQSGAAVRPLSGGDIAFSFYSGFNDFALCLARTDSAGTPLWTRRYPGAYSYPTAGMKIEAGTPESIVVVGRFYDGGSSGAQLLRVTAADGTPSLDTAYFGPPETTFDTYFTDEAFVPGGDYFVAGGASYYVPESDEYKTDMLVARIDRNGNVVWCNLYDQILPDFDSTDEGRGIAILGSGDIAVVGRTSTPPEYVGQVSAMHLRLDQTTGAVLAVNVIDDVEVASASLEVVANGNLLSSGTRIFGDGDGAAQMWVVDPANMQAQWRAEYPDGRSFGYDAVEQPQARDGSNYVLAGSNYPYSVSPIGSPDQMFIRTDESGNDNCAVSYLLVAPIPVEVRVKPFVLTRIALEDPVPFEGQTYADFLETRLVCAESSCPGDLNGDGFVDDADFVIFVNAYNILDCFDPSMPPGCPADLNGDDFVDDADFVIFVMAYNELICP